MLFYVVGRARIQAEQNFKLNNSGYKWHSKYCNRIIKFVVDKCVYRER